MGITGFNAAQYARTSHALERVLRQIEANAGMAAAIQALEQQQRDPTSRGKGTPVAAHHPVPTMYFQGSRDTVIGSVKAWVTNWPDAHRHITSTLAANIIATCDAASGDCNVFFVPRSMLFERVPMLGGRPASLGARRTRSELHAGAGPAEQRATDVREGLGHPGCARNARPAQTRLVETEE
jgi:hypothetical protein